MEQHTFGHWLRYKRKALDLTREGLGERVGCSAATIRKIEAEERRPSEQIAGRLAEIFNIPKNERDSFLRFARGDLKSAPVETNENQPWHTSVKSQRSNIPATTTSLIAREKETAEIREYLAQNHIRLVTLIGPPGIGKTRLSIAAARAALSDFPDGVFFVPLAPLDDPTLIAPAVANALGYVRANNIPAKEQLNEGIGNKQILIVLDNCEHLIEEAALLASFLLSACPRLKMLATSRESFRIPGEWQYPVPAFDLPNKTDTIVLDNVSDFPALLLFVERARAVKPEFNLTAENVQPIVAICSRLDGLPLVIELIAARMRIMSPQALLERLSAQFVLTADGMRAASERQKTLQNAIDWSYNLLSADEQKFFVCLSVFSGGFELEAVETIFADNFKEKSVTELLTLLLDKSLIRRTMGSAHEDRYEMLVTIQEYARQRLEKSGEETEIRNRHLGYFLALAEQADKEIHGPNQIAWMARLDAEHDNFRTALDWAISSKQLEFTLRLFNGLAWAWLTRNRFSEVRGRFDQIRSLSEATSYPILYARMLNSMGRLNWLLYNFHEAQSFLDESKAIWQRLGADGERGLAEALSFMGLIAYSRNKDLKTAQGLFEESLKLYQKCEDQWGTAFDLFQLGMLAVTRADDSSALSLLEQSLGLFQRLEDIWGKSRVSQFFGELFLREENYEKAHFFFEQNLRFDEELKFKPGIVVALSNLGNLHCYQGEYDQAGEYFEKSLAVSRAYGMKDTWGFGLYSLGLIALHQNIYSLARQYFADHFKAYNGSFDKVSAGRLFLSQAAITAGTNQLERAARLSGAARVIFETLDYRISRFDQTEFDRHVQIAREQLGEKRFEAIRAEGSAMTMKQAIAYALEDTES